MNDEQRRRIQQEIMNAVRNTMDSLIAFQESTGFLFVPKYLVIYSNSYGPNLRHVDYSTKFFDTSDKATEYYLHMTDLSDEFAVIGVYNEDTKRYVLYQPW